jgi:hypothetical protein
MGANPISVINTSYRKQKEQYARKQSHQKLTIEYFNNQELTGLFALGGKYVITASFYDAYCS